MTTIATTTATNVNLLVLNASTPGLPENPTNQTLISTAPPQPYSAYNNTTGLNGNVVTAMISQQAVMAANLPDSQKINQGILNTTAAPTLAQISVPGQLIKPGSGQFIQNLRSANPTISFNMAASNTLMTGNAGVATTENLTSNTSAQVEAINNSIQTTATTLKNTGAIKSNDTSVITAGAVMAASIYGIKTLSDMGFSLQQVPSIVGGISNKIGSAITNGKYAAGIADGNFAGAAGLATSISSINGYQQPQDTNLTQSAFQLAEQSFGEMKPGEVNYLGGVGSNESNISKTLTASIDNQRAQEELTQAEILVQQARKEYYMEETPANLEKLRRAEAAVVDAQKKLVKSKMLLSDYQVKIDMVNSRKVVDGDTLTSTVYDTSNTTNSGINALPGGLGAFANQVGSTASNIIPAVSNAIKGVASGVGSGVKSIVAVLKENFGGASSSIVSAINSFGYSPGFIKSPIVTSNTGTVSSAVISSTLDATLEPKVPPPSFGIVVPDFTPDQYQRAQVDAQLEISELQATRETIAYQLDKKTQEWLETRRADLIDEMDVYQKELTALDARIVAAQIRYERIISNQ